MTLYWGFAMRSFSQLIGCVLMFLLAGSPLFAETEKIYTLGVVPQQSPAQMAKVWIPVARYLSKQTGYKFKFITAKNIPEFEKELKNGKYDFAYMNPYHYVVYHKLAGYEAFAHAQGKKIKGIIVVHKDSSYQTLEDLYESELAFPSPLAFAATLLPTAEFERRNIKYTPKYVGSHDSVYLNVALGRMSAGGGVLRTFNAVSKNIRDELRILYTTGGYTPHAFAAHPDIPQDVVAEVQKVMVNMHRDTKGKTYMNRLKIKGIEIAVDADWNDVRKLEFQ